MDIVLVINLKAAKKYFILKTIKTFFQLQFLKKTIRLMIGLLNYLFWIDKSTFKNKNKILQSTVQIIILIMLVPPKIESVKE